MWNWPNNWRSANQQGLAIVGKTETENIGLDKVIKNVITNPAMRFLIVAGHESEGHRSGQTLLALAAHGVDAKGRVIGSSGKRPILRNVSLDEINAFRQQVQVIDLIGCENLDEIADRIATLAQSAAPACSCGTCSDTPAPVAISTVTTLTATESADTVIMDKAGYFVVVPLSDRQRDQRRTLRLRRHAAPCHRRLERARLVPDHYCQSVGQ